jgi:hypothetical protein
MNVSYSIAKQEHGCRADGDSLEGQIPPKGKAGRDATIMMRQEPTHNNVGANAGCPQKPLPFKSDDAPENGCS